MRVSRATTVDGVLETIHELGGDAVPQENEDDDDRDLVFRGYPLPQRPAGAAFVFYGAWPGIALLAALRSRRRGS